MLSAKKFWNQLKEEAKEFDAHSEGRKVAREPLEADKAKFINGALIAPGGRGWTGPNLHLLHEAMRNSLKTPDTL